MWTPQLLSSIHDAWQTNLHINTSTTNITNVDKFVLWYNEWSLQTRQQAMFPLHQATDGHMTTWWPQYDHIWSVADFTSSITTRGLCSKNVDKSEGTRRQAVARIADRTASQHIMGPGDVISHDHVIRDRVVTDWTDQVKEDISMRKRGKHAGDGGTNDLSQSVDMWYGQRTISCLMKFAHDERNVANNKIILVMYIELIRCAWRRTKTNK